MNNPVKAAVGVILILAAAVWSFAKYKETRLGGVANNGNNGETPEISEQTREKMRSAWENRPPRTAQGPPTEEERRQAREEFEKVLTPEDKKIMEKAQSERERSRATAKAALSPEEQKIMENRFRGRRGGRGGTVGIAEGKTVAATLGSVRGSAGALQGDAGFVVASEADGTAVQSRIVAG